MTVTSESRKATKTIGIRLTPEQHELVCELANSNGVGPSTLTREALLKMVKAPVSRERQKRNGLQIAVGSWTSEANRIARILSQLANSADQGGRVDVSALDALRAEIVLLHEAVLTATGTSP